MPMSGRGPRSGEWCGTALPSSISRVHTLACRRTRSSEAGIEAGKVCRMESRDRRSVLVLLVVSVFLAILAQHYLSYKRAFMWDGLFLYFLAMLLFGLVVARAESRPRGKDAGRGSLWLEIWQLLSCSSVRLVVLLVGIGCVVYVAAVSGSRSAGSSFWDLIALWIIGVALGAGAFVDWATLPRRLRRKARVLLHPGPEAVFVVILAIGAFLLRGTRLDSIPFVLSDDEAAMGMEAIAVMEGRLTSPFVTGWLSHPTLFFFLQAAFLRFFGTTTVALRLPSALVSSATLVLLYVFARRYYGRWVAIVAAVFFCTYHYAIHYGRSGLNNIWDPCFALGVFYLTSRGLEAKRLGDLLAAGLLMGLAIYFYMGARLIPIILVVYLVYWALRRPGLLHDNLAYLAVFGLMALIVALPLLAFFARHPQDMMARWTWLGIFPSGWVEQEMQRTGKGTLGVLFGQFVKSVLAFNCFPDPTFHYRPGIPLLRFFTSVLFVFGLTYALRKWREREYFLLLAWYLLVIIFGGVLLENPPSSPRLVLAIPPVVICVALGMVKISSYIQLTLNRGRELAVGISVILLLFASYQSVFFYFAKYTPSHAFGNLNTEVADTVGRYLRVLGPDYQCYFFGPPRIYYRGIPSIPFIARGVTGTDVVEPITDGVDFVNPERRAVFVFLPERRSEFSVVQRFYPSGRFREFYNQKGQILFFAYEADD